MDDFFDQEDPKDPLGILSKPKQNGKADPLGILEPVKKKETFSSEPFGYLKLFGGTSSPTQSKLPSQEGVSRDIAGVKQGGLLINESLSESSYAPPDELLSSPQYGATDARVGGDDFGSTKNAKTAAGVYNTLVSSVARIAGGMGEIIQMKEPTLMFRPKGELQKEATGFIEQARSGVSTKEEEAKRMEFDVTDGVSKDDVKALLFQAPSTLLDMVAGSLSGGGSFILQAVSDASEELDNNPNAQNLNDAERMGYIYTNGLIQGALERLGVNKVLKSTGANKFIQKKIANEITEELISKGEKVGADQIEKEVLKKVGSLSNQLKTGGIGVLKSMGWEGGTEATQQALSDLSRIATNRISGNEIFNEQDIVENFAKNVINAGTQGGAMGGLFGGGALLSNNAESIKKQINSAETQAEIEQIKNRINKEVQNGNLTKGEVIALQDENKLQENILATDPKGEANLNHATKVRENIQELGLSDAAQNEYVAQSLKEKTALSNAEKLTDPTLIKQQKAEAKEAQEIKEQLLQGKNPEEIVTESQQKKIDEEEKRKTDLQRLQEDFELENKKFDEQRKGLDGRTPEDRPKIEALELKRKRAKEDFKKAQSKLQPKEDIKADPISEAVKAADTDIKVEAPSPVPEGGGEVKGEPLPQIEPDKEIVEFSKVGKTKILFDRKNKKFAFETPTGRISSPKQAKLAAYKITPRYFRAWWREMASDEQKAQVETIRDEMLGLLQKAQNYEYADDIETFLMRMIRDVKFHPSILKDLTDVAKSKWTTEDVDNIRKGFNLDTFVQDQLGIDKDGLLEQEGFSGYSEAEVMEMIKDIIRQYPNGIRAKDISDRVKEDNPLYELERLEDEFIELTGLDINKALEIYEDEKESLGKRQTEVQAPTEVADQKEITNEATIQEGDKSNQQSNIPPKEESKPSEPTIETTPPAEPPKGEAAVGGEETDLPERRFTKQMLRDEDLTPEVKEGIAKTLNYIQQTNEMSVKEAEEVLAKVGVDEAANQVMTNREMKGAVRVTLAQVVIKKYNKLAKQAMGQDEKDMYLDKTIQVATFVTENLATEPGQMIQAFSMWSRLSPEGQLRAANQDMAKQAKEKMRRREKDVKIISDKFKKANEEAADEVTKDKDVQETTKKDDNEKIAKAKDKIQKAKEKRANIINKYKDNKGKNLFSSPLGLTPEGIEFVGDIAKTYIEEGVANLEILAQKILIHLEDVAGKKPNDEIKKQVNDIADKEFGKADKSFLGKALKDKNIQVSKVVKQHYTEVDKTKRNLTQKLMDEAGMEQSNAKELAAKVEAAFDRIATRKKRNILYHEKARFDKIQKTFQTDKKAEPKTIQSEIIKFSNLGAFENQEMLDMLADRFGLKQLTPEQAGKLMQLAEKVQNAPEGSPKNNATEDLLAYRANIKGNDWGETAQAVWYANILSGYRTHEKNVVSTFFNSWAELGAEMIKDPKAIPYIIGGYMKGISKRGLVEARHTLMTGRSPIHIKKIETPTTLERKPFVGGGWNPANWFKYVTRLMVAEDVLSFQGLKEARAYQLARREAAKAGANTWTRKGWDMVNEKLFHTRERWLIAQDQAETEGLKQNTLEWRRRIYELMENSRPEKMTEDAYSFAAHGTFNYESTGTLGAFTNAVAKALDVDVAGVKPARFIVPFTRIITNVVNNSLDFTPVGLVRAARGVRGFKSFEDINITKGAFKELSREERQRLVAKAATGIAMAATLQAIHLAGALVITGGGPDDKKKKQQLKEQGWEEYSVKIGNKWYSYKYTPLVFMLGWMGNWNDATKYNDEDEQTTSKKAQIAFLRMGNQVVDMTWINSAGTFLGALADGTPNEQGRKVSDALAGMARGFIPYSQAITQTTGLTQSIFNQPAKQVNGAWQALIQDIPIARNSLNDKINSLGEPVTKDIDVFYSKVNPDPIWQFLDEKQGWVATLTKSSVFVFDQKSKQDRPITEDEFYELAKLRGGLIKESIKDIIKNGYPVIRNGEVVTVKGEDMTPKEVNEVLSIKEKEATKIAKAALFGEKVISEEEADLKKELQEERGLLKPENDQ